MHNIYYKKSMTQYLKNERKLRKERIKYEFRYQLYMGSICLICGQKNRQIEYHHICPLNEKKDNVSRLIKDGYAPRTIIKEMEKCVPLCKMCHKHIHKYKINLLEES